jgi:signal transduction histidine kinase
MLVTEMLGAAPLPPDYLTPAYRWAEFSTTIVGVGSLFYLVINSLEKALAQARLNEQEALEASEFKTQLIARISHELRTPLGAILGLAEMLEDCSVCGTLSPEQSRIAQKIVRNSHRLNRLVAELLDQTQFESGRLRLKNETFSPGEMVANVVAMERPRVEGKGLTLRMDVVDGVPDTVLGDPNRVEQILHSLMDNATKFTKEGGVGVRVYLPGDGCWAMQVSDTGIGIPEAAQAYIFDPFRQVDESVTREYGGLGLGLTVVRQLAALMGGEITLESKVGQGSTFTVILPQQPIKEGHDG